MSDYVRFIRGILLWAVALMSGILSILREALTVFAPDQVLQRSLFWNCVIISFVISAAILWVLEHKKVIALTNKLDTGQKNKAISDKLATFRINGLAIQNQCYGGPPLYQGKTFRQAYEQWDQEIDDFATQKLSNSELADLKDVYDENPKKFVTSEEHTWTFVGRKIKRLEEVDKKYR